MKTKIESLNTFRIVSLDNIDGPLMPHVTEKRSQLQLAGAVICDRICICCGESIVERGNSMSRNPNVCASCSSLADGMGEEGSQPEADGCDREAGFPVPIRYRQ